MALAIAGFVPFFDKSINLKYPIQFFFSLKNIILKNLIHQSSFSVMPMSSSSNENFYSRKKGVESVVMGFKTSWVTVQLIKK